MPSEKFWTASASLPGPLRLPRHRRLLMIGTFLSLFAAPRSKCAKFNIPRCRRKINNQVRFEGESRRLDISPPYRKLGGSLAGGGVPGGGGRNQAACFSYTSHGRIFQRPEADLPTAIHRLPRLRPCLSSSRHRFPLVRLDRNDYKKGRLCMGHRIGSSFRCRSTVPNDASGR